MATTFEGLWRQCRNLFPGVPALVVRQWAQDAYAEACRFHGWGFLRREGVLSILDARSIAVTLTQGSATVTSAGLFVSTDQGRQFRVGNYPVYTIRTFTDINTIVLDRTYSATGGSATAQVLDAYTVLPTDFGSFLNTWDPYNQRILPWWYNQDQIAIADPSRSISDSGPRFLVAFTPSQETATLGQVRYEYHPYPTSARQYPYLYSRVNETLADATTLPGLFSQHPDVLKKGITKQAAEWPGTRDQPNPYFNLGLADRVGKDWELALQRLSLDDDEQYPTQLLQVDWARLGSGLTVDARTLRSTDATVADLY